MAGRPRNRAGRERSRRVRLLAGVAVLLFGLLAVRAAFLGTVRADELSERGSQQHRFAIDLPAQRGAITARDGGELAVDRLAVDVSATPYEITDPLEAAAQLAPILERDADVLANAMSGPGGYARLAANVPPKRADRAKALHIPGIHFTDTWQRFLPGGPVASQVLGLTGSEPSGLELQLDDILTGEPGRRAEIRDLFGRPIQVLADREPEPGTDVELTLDRTIQERVEYTLAAARERYGAASATAIVMRPDDGAILAMATVPRFDPNRRAELNQDLARNRPVTDVFEPGSTFKMVTMVAALEDRKVTPSTRFSLPLEYKRYDRTLTDTHREEEVTWTATEILEHSSNIGITKIGERVGDERLSAWIKRFGFGSPTGIDFPGEVRGLLPPVEQWSGVPRLPIGHGISVTLAQLTRAYAAIANGGFLVEPHLVAQVGGEPVAHPRGKQIVTTRTVRQIDRMLRRVVSDEGTGALAQVDGFEVAGKTGTANKIDPETGEYSTARYWSSFVGYVPANDPQLLIAVVVDEPTQGAYYGGDVAAPAFEDIAEFSLQTMRISP
jgi:cell division protein FtsI (penicillin-binding protein 3)